MEITVRVEVQYFAPEHAVLQDVLHMLRRPVWVRFMMRYISPRLKTASPADKSVLEHLHSDWVVASGNHDPNPATEDEIQSQIEEDTHETQPQTRPQDQDQDHDCVICLTPSSSLVRVRLPCGHSFHRDCVESWLQERSTCPSCRYQFRKAFAGTFAVHSLASTVRLGAEHEAMARDAILRHPVGQQVVHAVVQVSLVKVPSAEKQREYPCELSAQLMHTNGEVFTEWDADALTTPTAMVPCDEQAPGDRVDQVQAGAGSRRCRECDESLEAEGEDSATPPPSKRLRSA